VLDAGWRCTRTHPVAGRRRIHPRETNKTMPTCEHCASRNVRWFTPTRFGNRAAVLLCMACQRLTIQPPRISRWFAPATTRASRAA
jgi:hypothetical protein